MKLAGLNFTKINVEKSKNDFKDLKINTSINLEEITEAKADLIKSKDIFLSIKFKYGINYDPEIAKIEFEGGILISVDQKTGKEILNDWKEKKVKDETRLILFNLILRKSNIKALQLEEEMNLPIHFKLPSLQMDKKE